MTTVPIAVAIQLAADGAFGISDAPNIAAIINGPNTLSHVGKRASVLLALCLLFLAVCNQVGRQGFVFPGSSPAQDDEEPEDPVDKPDETSGEVRVGNDDDGEKKQVFSY